MKRFRCRCGERVFFENTLCLACGSNLGFDPGTMEMVPTQGYKLCRNQRDFGNCNWLLSSQETDQYCLSCRLNRTIPNLGSGDNKRRWRILEAAKRRLLYSLLALGLPVKSKVRGWPDGLAFDFIEDQQSNPDMAEQYVSTGHSQGVITINIAEADDVYRLQMRQIMGELYRTVLGHFRHESGHYYFDLLVSDNAVAGFRDAFGDDRIDYQQALQDHYDSGPNGGWRAAFVSAYASVHPLEDWAETWAHYLLITDVVETAAVEGLAEPADDLDRNLQVWADTTVKINQVTRGLGLEDPYPFVINDRVRDKLRFIDRLLRDARSAAVL